MSARPVPRAIVRDAARAVAAALAACLCIAVAPAAAQRAADAPPALERLGAGRLAAFRQGSSTLLLVPPDAIGKPFVWYTEVVGVPAGMVADGGLEVASTLARFERNGEVLHVRDLGVQIRRRGGTVRTPSAPPGPQAGAAPAAPAASPAPGPSGAARAARRDAPSIEAPVPGAAPRDAKRRPIDVALGALETGALIAAFPIVGADPQGAVMVDATPVFSNDIGAASGRGFVVASGRVPAALDPARSYVERVRVRGDGLTIRSHLTYLAVSPEQPALGPQPVSIVLGHSLVFLPETPMAARPADPRVGYFPVQYVEFEAERGAAQEVQTIIARFRLEKANPKAAVSDPVKPITFFIGPGVPERWRPYLAAGVLQWLPAFEAAGFSNAIRVRNAPTPQEDPDWSPEDPTINVIRWVPQERANAMGPHVVDPRSGEVLSAHILVWPSVVDYFGQYYWALFGGGVDPRAAKLPLPEAISGGILQYAVAHEVGHTLGLMHNQLASTAHTVAQLRDARFANRAGPNSSIMAYGRFNYVAQPGDGVTQLWGTVGPYDVAAIRYGYGVFGTDRDSERSELARFAESFGSDRRLYFGSEEGIDLLSRFARDPRVQTENVGAERVQATRLGIANIRRSFDRLDAATSGDAALYRSTYGVMLGRHVGLLKSVKRLVGGAMPPLGRGEGPTAILVPAAEQRDAVRFLLGEGATSLEPYATPAVVERVAVYGGYRAIDRLQADLVGDLLEGPTLALLESQKRRDASAYSSLELGRDVMDAVWGDLGAASPTRRALQRGWIDASRRLLVAWAGDGADEAQEAKLAEAQKVPSIVARALLESGDDTLYVPWLRAALPDLKARLDAAARATSDETARLHFAEMAVQVTRLMRLASG